MAKSTKAETFIQYLLANKILRQRKTDPNDPDTIALVECKGVGIDFDGVGILEISKYGEGDYVVITPYGRESLNEISLTDKNLKKFEVNMMQAVDLSKLTK